MVLIDSCSMSVLATKLLVQTLLSFPSRTICLRPGFLWLELVSERRLGRLVTAPFQSGNGRAAERGLFDGRLGDRPRERVGDDLDPGRVTAEASARRDDRFELRQEVGDRGEAKGDALERRPAEIARRRLEGQAGHGARRVGVPPGRALAAEEREKREPVVVPAGGAIAKRLVEPDPEIAAVRERTALDDAPPVEDVEKEARPRARAIRLVEDPERRRG